MKAYPFVLIGFLTALAACQSKNELKELRRELDLSACKIVLLEANTKYIPIVRIDQSSPSTTVLYFEDKTSYLIKNSYLISIDQNPDAWRAQFNFIDGVVVSCAMVGHLKIDSTMITLDPFGRAPLTAIAKVVTPITGRFIVVVHGKKPAGVTISKAFDEFGTTHQLPILGLYANYNNQVEFIFTDRNGVVRDSVSVAIKTGALPISPTINVTKRSDFSDQGLYFNSNLPIAYDQNGDVRWYYTGDFSSLYRKLKNGNILIVSSMNITSLGSKSFFEVSMLGQIKQKYDVPNYFHHEIIEMPNGNFLVATNSEQNSLGNIKTIADEIVEIDRISGKAIKTWDFNLILDPKRQGLPDVKPGDWLHLNSIFFDQTDNSIIISSRSQSAVAKIAYPSGEVKWILANPNNWSDNFKNLLLQPVNHTSTESEFLKDFWPYGQHSVKLISNGNLLLYDNGDYREYYDDNLSPQISYTRVAQYKINEEQKTVELVWQFTNNKEIFTYYTGYTEYLPNSKYLIAYMNAPGPDTPKVIEVNEAGTILYESTINTGFSYRTYKYDIYQDVTERSISF